MQGGPPTHKKSPRAPSGRSAEVEEAGQVELPARRVAAVGAGGATCLREFTITHALG